MADRLTYDQLDDTKLSKLYDRLEAAERELEVLRARVEATRRERDAAWRLLLLLKERRDGDNAYRQAKRERDQLAAALAEVERLCRLTLGESCRAGAVEMAQDVLAILAQHTQEARTDG